jgi:hypothetical protein
MEAEARANLLEATAGDAKRQPVRALQDWVDELYGGGKPAGVSLPHVAGYRHHPAAAVTCSPAAGSRNSRP